MAAQILGGKLGRPILQVDLASVLAGDGREPEELTRHLFAAAENSNAILFFDHADALLSRRSRAARRAERTAGGDAARLIERSERYPGVVVFASELAHNNDALTGLVAHVIEFPFPESEARKEIWRKLLPGDARVRETDLDFLATSFKLAGGRIGACCVRAAADARQERIPVDMLHVARALEQEYRLLLMSASTRNALEQLRSTTGLGAMEPDAATSAPPPPKPRWRIQVRPRSAALGISATLVVALLGFLFARSTGGRASQPALDKHALAGSVQLSYPSAWRQQTPPASLPVGLTDELALGPTAPSGAQLVIGRAATGGAPLAPKQLLAAIPNAPAAQIVSLGGLAFYRYLNLPPRGNNLSESVYALPTTIGTIVGVCATPQPQPSFTSSCERLLGTIRLSSGSVLPLGPSGNYASALDRVLNKLNAIRISAGSQLRSARNARAQAKAADELAAAHHRAASALGRLDAGSASAVNTALANALRATGDAYAALGQAALHNDRAGYSAATIAVTHARNALNSALVELGSLGYRVS
jgi:hypothetical protein